MLYNLYIHISCKQRKRQTPSIFEAPFHQFVVEHGHCPTARRLGGAVVKCSNLQKPTFFVGGPDITVTSNPRKTKKKLQYHDASRSKTKFRNRSFVALILWQNKNFWIRVVLFGNPETFSAAKQLPRLLVFPHRPTLFWPLAAYRPGSARPGAWGIWVPLNDENIIPKNQRLEATGSLKMMDFGDFFLFHKVPRQSSISGNAWY